MGQADGKGVGPSGNSGGGSSGNSGGSSGGGRGNNTPGRDARGNTSNNGGRDTPGSPNAPDGKRGSTMGRDGGTATGSGRGNNTPGAPDNPGRVGRHAKGTTSSSRARGAMSRHSNESAKRNGIGAAYSLTDSLISKAKTESMSPKDMDMAVGMVQGRQAGGLMGVMGGSLASGLGQLGAALGISAPGVGSTASKAVGSAVKSGMVADNPESKYGAARAEARMQNNTVQDAAQFGASLSPVPGLGFATAQVNNAVNMNRTSNIGELSSAIGMDDPGPSGPNNPSGKGSASPTTTAPSTAPQRARQAFSPARSFESPTIDMGAYSGGLMSLSQNL